MRSIDSNQQANYNLNDADDDECKERPSDTINKSKKTQCKHTTINVQFECVFLANAQI